jgi:hypothetical protein
MYYMFLFLCPQFGTNGYSLARLAAQTPLSIFFQLIQAFDLLSAKSRYFQLFPTFVNSH